jgi:hypothetical protein
MNVYPLLVFAHVLGAAGIFGALASEAVSLRALRLAEAPATAAVATRLLAGPPILGPIAGLTTIASGIAMMAMAWGHQPWIVVAFVGIVAMGALGGAVTGRRIRRLRAALRTETPSSALLDAFRSGRASAALSASLRLRIALGVGIVGLMTAKPPDYATSLLVLGAAALGGVVASLPLAARPPPLEARRAA